MMRQSRAETLVTEEPYALIAHVWVCGGASRVTAGFTRKPTPYSFRSASAFGRGSPRAFGAQVQSALKRKRPRRQGGIVSNVLAQRGYSYDHHTYP